MLGAVLVLGAALILGCPDGLKLELGIELGAIQPLTSYWHHGPYVGFAYLFGHFEFSNILLVSTSSEVLSAHVERHWSKLARE